MAVDINEQFPNQASDFKSFFFPPMIVQLCWYEISNLLYSAGSNEMGNAAVWLIITAVFSELRCTVKQSNTEVGIGD